MQGGSRIVECHQEQKAAYGPLPTSYILFIPLVRDEYVPLRERLDRSLRTLREARKRTVLRIGALLGDQDAKKRLELIGEFKKRTGAEYVSPYLYNRSAEYLELRLKQWEGRMGEAESRRNLLQRAVRAKIGEQELTLGEGHKAFFDALARAARDNDWAGLEVLAPGRSVHPDSIREGDFLRYLAHIHPELQRLAKKYGARTAAEAFYLFTHPELHKNLVFDEQKPVGESKKEEEEANGMVLRRIRRRFGGLRRKISEKLRLKREKTPLGPGEPGPEEKALAEAVMKEKRSVVRMGNREYSGEELKELKRRVGGRLTPKTDVEKVLELGPSEREVLRGEASKAALKNVHPDLWEIHRELARMYKNPEVEMLLDVLNTMKIHDVNRMTIKLGGQKREITAKELEEALRKYTKERKFEAIMPYVAYLDKLMENAHKIRNAYAERDSAANVRKIGAIQPQVEKIAVNPRDLAREHIAGTVDWLREVLQRDPRYRRIAWALQDEGFKRILEEKLKYTPATKVKVDRGTLLELQKALQDRAMKHVESVLEELEANPNIVGKIDPEHIRRAFDGYEHLLGSYKPIKSPGNVKLGKQNLEELVKQIANSEEVRKALSKHTRKLLENPTNPRAIQEIAKAIHAEIMKYGATKNLAIARHPAAEGIAIEIAERLAKEHARTIPNRVVENLASRLERDYRRMLEARGITGSLER